MRPRAVDAAPPQSKPPIAYRRRGRNCAENAMNMTEHSPLAAVGTDTAIRLRWALRDIKAGRTKSMPVSSDDLAKLIGLGLIELHDDEPMLTDEAHRALDWS